jgi:hypothetical protein
MLYKGTIIRRNQLDENTVELGVLDLRRVNRDSRTGAPVRRALYSGSSQAGGSLISRIVELVGLEVRLPYDISGLVIFFGLRILGFGGEGRGSYNFVEVCAAMGWYLRTKENNNI